MRTSIGDFFRKIRIAKGELLKDMAEQLEVTSAFLSAVENGKKNMPETWYEKFKSIYGISDKQVLEMKQAYMESQKKLAINLENTSSLNREAAILFARYFDEFDDETSKKIVMYIKSRKKGE